MTLANVKDVEAALLRPLGDFEKTILPTLLARADGLIAEALPDVKFDGLVLNATATVTGSGKFEFWLPGTPVTAVASITVDGVLLDPDDYSWASLGDVSRIGGVWPLNSVIGATWSYGHASVPSSIVAVAADIVRRTLANPSSDIRQQSTGSVSVTYAIETLESLNLEAYYPIFNHYRYPVVI